MADTGGPTHFNILTSVIIDDPEIGAYLNKTYGIPVWVAAFQEQDSGTGPVALHTWTWTIGSQPSSMTILDDGDVGPESGRYDRYFWQHGPGLVVLDLDKDAQGPAIPQTSNGTLNPPMVVAQETDGQFAGFGEWFPSLEVSGTFTFYADQACKEPLPGDSA